MTSWTDPHNLEKLMWDYYWVAIIGVFLIGSLINSIKDWFK